MAEPDNRQNQNRQKRNSGGNGSQKPDGDFDWSKIIRTVFSWGIVIIAAVIIMQFMRSGSSGAVEVTYNQYEDLLNKDKIAEAKIYKTDVNDYRFEGTLTEPEKNRGRAGQLPHNALCG